MSKCIAMPKEEVIVMKYISFLKVYCHDTTQL